MCAARERTRGQCDSSRSSDARDLDNLRGWYQLTQTTWIAQQTIELVECIEARNFDEEREAFHDRDRLTTIVEKNVSGMRARRRDLQAGEFPACYRRPFTFSTKPLAFAQDVDHERSENGAILTPSPRMSIRTDT
jgi:hypothetical protein